MTAYADIANYASDPGLFGRKIVAACFSFDFPDGAFSPPDITSRIYDILRDYQMPDTIHRIYGTAYTNVYQRKCRGFLWEDEKLLATSLVDPSLPGSRVAWQFDVLARDGDQANGNAQEKLDSRPLHKQFYMDINAWFKRLHTPSFNELRHLIRILFAYLMQSRGVLPDIALWNPAVQVPNDGFDVHDRIEWLFTNVLATDPAKRISNELGNERKSLLEAVPFLNGSLFTELPITQRPERLENATYLATGATPGLLTILRRYDWTLSEPTSSESESALDPSLLGTLFERLMLSVEGPRREADGKKKMPDGTYYTPQDIADEMAADAIGHWLAGHIAGIEFSEFRALAHPMPSGESWRDWSKSSRSLILDEVRSIRVLDPCCGSGAFTVAMLQALSRSVSRLSQSEVRSDIEHIIKRQLYAADIHPIAILVTRLRLFIALTEWRLRNGDGARPLPNLETRCVAVDSLYVRCSDDKLATSLESDQLVMAVKSLQDARERWTTAHSDKAKASARTKESEARAELRRLSEWTPDIDSSWLDIDFLAASTTPATIDLRQLLVVPTGWDIVIGNPPYQKSDKGDLKLFRRRGYQSASANLYTLFTEMAIEATKPDGCTVLIVPHSIVFHRRKPYLELRHHIEKVSKSIYIRTFDNRPLSMFPTLPWLKGTTRANDNRQRVTVVAIRKGAGHPSIFSRGILRLSVLKRREILKTSRLGQRQPPVSRQWTQAPSATTADLLIAMRAEGKRGVPESTESMRRVLFPNTAMYFLSAIPEGLVDVRNWQRHFLPQGKLGWAWIGLYNSHLFHAYWLMVGDAFHVTREEICTIKPPRDWNSAEVLDRTGELAQELFSPQIVSACRKDYHGRGGSLWPNLDFHQGPGNAIITELDHLLIRAYGLPETPLLQEIRRMRIGSSHEVERL